MGRKVTIRTFPTEEGDTSCDVDLSTVTPEQVFTTDTRVLMGRKVYTTWDELLADIQEKQEDEEVEILRYLPPRGG